MAPPLQARSCPDCLVHGSSESLTGTPLAVQMPLPQGPVGPGSIPGRLHLNCRLWFKAEQSAPVVLVPGGGQALVGPHLQSVVLPQQDVGDASGSVPRADRPAPQLDAITLYCGAEREGWWDHHHPAGLVMTPTSSVRISGS